ncbi:hypothetical protein D3C72_948420 [compost metagenome]
MSGKKQHFIPQVLLRGFARETRGNHRLWVHHRDRGTFESNVQDVAASRFFYSGPRAENAPATLDDRITAYEDQLAKHLATLRRAPPGPVADDNLAREVVSHLAFRTAATRDLVSEAMLTTQRLKGWMTTPTAMLAFIGADRDRPGERFEAFLDVMRADPRWSTSFGAARPRRVRKLMFEAVRNDPTRFTGRMMEETAREMEFLLREHRELAREAHVDALTQDVVSKSSMRGLAGLAWSIFDYDDLPLPDTVVLASRDGREFCGLSWLSPAERQDVIMPLSNGRLLQGQRLGTGRYELESIKKALIRGSDSFFVSKDPINELDITTIGQAKIDTLDRTIAALVSDVFSGPLRRSSPDRIAGV